jgi:hypothetical protein
MRAPAVPGKANLFEMDGTLRMSSFNDAATTIDIWMTQDYESEAWAIKYRVELLATAQLTVMFAVGTVDGVWPRLWMVMCSCWSNLVTGYFRLTWIARLLPVSSVHYAVPTNFASNKVLFRIPSFQHWRVMW